MNDLKLLLDIRNLAVSFGHGPRQITAVQNFNLSMQAGEVVALVGESGSGKTVSAMSILQLLPYPQAHHPAGQIYFKGQDLLKASAQQMQKIRGKEISVIFQEPMTSLNPLHRIEKQIAEIITIHQPISQKLANNRCHELLHLVGIDNPKQKAQSYPHELSGGQRQRVMIAMALANNPQLLIADEPTTALDVTIQAQVLKLLKKLQAEFKMAMLFISHDLGLVAKIADRILVMRQGQVVEEGPVSQMLSSPNHPYTRQLIQSYPQPKQIQPAGDKDILLQAQNVRVWFPIRRGFLMKVSDYVRAVQDVSLTIKTGQTIGLVGESGSGKSTLAMALLQLVPYQGQVVYQGQELHKLRMRQLRQLRQHMQVIFQDPYGSLSPRLSVAEIVREGLDIHCRNLSFRDKNERVMHSLTQVGLLPEHLNRYPHEFSGGQRQRIAIARALVLRPQLLILDEPTSALDMTTQAQIIQLLQKLQQEYQLTYIFISHDLRVIRAMADYLIIMRQGQVIEQGVAADIFANPQNAYTKKLLNAAISFETADDDQNQE
jgi:microcin C transport system ATP-binding protein